jgi:hypothetical protein
MYEGKLYFGFGLNNFFEFYNDLWVFDPKNNSFTQLPSCPCEPRFHPALVALNGKLYMGTGTAKDKDLDDWWEYDIASKTWTELDAVPGGVRHHPFQFSVDDYIVIGGGHVNVWSKFNTKTKEWSPIKNLDDRLAGIQFEYGGKGFLLSGLPNDSGSFPTGEFWEYNNITGNWKPLTPHPEVSRWAPSSFIIDDYIYMFGGRGEMGDTTNTMYKYNLKNLTSTINGLNSLQANISPNPFTSTLNIQIPESVGKNGMLEVYNYVGKIVFQKRVDYNSPLNLSFLPNGIYWMMLKNENLVFANKIIKQ